MSKVGTFGLTLQGQQVSTHAKSLITELAALGIPESSIFTAAGQNAEDAQQARQNSRYSLAYIDSSNYQNEPEMSNISQQLSQDPTKQVVIFDTMTGSPTEQKAIQNQMASWKSRFPNGHIYNRSEGLNFLQQNLSQSQ